MTAWVVRAGRDGEREQWALDEGVAGGGFWEVADLTAAKSRDDVAAKVAAGFPDAPVGRTSNFTGQLWALRDRIHLGDLVVMPMKTTKKLALGVCSGGYNHRDAESDVSRRHTVTVDWKRDDVSRAAIKDDLLNTLNGAMTIFQASNNMSEARLRAVLQKGVDPGTMADAEAGTAKAQQPAEVVTDEVSADVVDPTPAPTLEAIRDRVRTYLVENFRRHKLSYLVADILRVQGYVCEVSPEGPDSGVDIIAGRGPLGLDSPTVIVEVKSESGQIGAPVVRGLHGAMASHKADQGLLVAWGGLNRSATAEIRSDRLTIRVWDAEDVLDQLFSVYDRLPEDTRTRLPLKRAWVLDQETG